MWLFAPWHTEEFCEHSLSAPGSEAWSSESSLRPGLKLWVLSSGKPIARLSSWRGWRTRSWLGFLSGTSSKLSIPDLGLEWWISSLRDSPASPSPSQASNERNVTSGGFGLMSGESLATYELATSSWKTFRGSLLTDSVTFSRTWPRAGGLRNGTAYPRQPAVPRTSAIVSFSSGLLPTPVASDTRNGQVSEATMGKNSRPLREVALRLPTPTARDHRASGTVHNWTKESGRNPGTTLTDAVVRTDGPTCGGMRLSPSFVEWMMGLPIGWTEIGVSGYTHSGMPLSPKPPVSRGRRSGGDFTSE